MRLEKLRKVDLNLLIIFAASGADGRSLFPIHKGTAVFDAGHIVPRNAMMRETLDWLDRYLGPVT
jgi:hypothetical protein